MKQTVLDVVEAKGEQMAALGYFPGVLAARWAEIAIEQSQDDESMAIYWGMKINLLGMRDN